VTISKETLEPYDSLMAQIWDENIRSITLQNVNINTTPTGVLISGKSTVRYEPSNINNNSFRSLLLSDPRLGHYF